MFAEQPSVKLCCQLCCNVFKDPVITTCGVGQHWSRPGMHEIIGTRAINHTDFVCYNDWNCFTLVSDVSRRFLLSNRKTKNKRNVNKLTKFHVCIKINVKFLFAPFLTAHLLQTMCLDFRYVLKYLDFSHSHVALKSFI